MAAQRILLIRAPHQASPLADALRAAGLEPVLIPTIEIAPPTSFVAFDAALVALAEKKGPPAFHWLVFTSANAVEAFAARVSALKGTGFSPSISGNQEKGALAPEGIRIAAIGPATARALQAIGLNPNLVPPQAVAESLAQALLPYATPGTRFLLVRAEQARDHLPQTLLAAGAEVTIAPAYRTVIPAGSADQIRKLFHSPAKWPDAIAFTSGSTVTNLLALLESTGLTLPPQICRVSIGPITSQALHDAGYPPHAEASESTTAALAAAIVQSLIPNP